MKLTAFILIFFGLHVSAKTASQSVTLSGTNLKLENVFAAVKKQTGFIVLFYGDALKDAKPVSVNAINKPVALFLEEIFKDQPLEFTINNTSIVINKKTKGLFEASNPLLQLPQDSTPLVKFKGTIMDINGQPLAGATIRIKKKNTTIASNNQGEFEIEAEVGNTLIVSYAGYITDEVKLGASHDIIVNLQPNALLEEAVIYNGYQKIQQKYLTGSVTSMKMDSIIQPGFTTVDKMLEGRVPGMIYMLNSGQVGAAPKLRIRGTSTILGSREPLWVVDGIIRTDPFPIPTSSLSDPDFVNLLGNAVSGLNPLDIDRIDVLKDATAAALYGVRAANGVIVITTKAGKSGPATLNYSTTGTYTRRPRYTDKGINMMNSRERVDVSREMIGREMTLRGGALEAYEKSIVDYYAGRIDYDTYKQQIDRAETANTDWFKAITRDVLSSQHSLSLAGGGPTSAYRASLGYNNEPGIIRNEYNKRYTGSMKVTVKSKKFQGEFNISLVKSERRYVPQEIAPLDYAYNISRAIPLYNEDGSLYYYSTVGSGVFDYYSKDIRTFNIINEMDKTSQKITTNGYVASANLNYEISKNIQLNTIVSYEGNRAELTNVFEEKTEWVKQIRSAAWDESKGIYTPISDPLPFGGELQQNYSTQNNLTVRSQVDFRTFIDPSNKHFIGGVIGGQINSMHNYSEAQKERGYYPDRGKSFANIYINAYPTFGTWLQDQIGNNIIERLENSARVFVSANYIYNENYVLSASAASDYSNSFGNRSNERFLPTWSLAGRWNLHNELFRTTSWMDMAALRLAFATSGNILSALTPNAIINKGRMNGYYEAFGSTIHQFPNPKLGWELTRDYNIGLDFSLFQGKIAGTIGYFKKRTSNAFLKTRVSLNNGIDAYTVNAGSLENHGLEINLQFIAFDSRTPNSKGGFTWRIDPNLGQVINQLIGRNLNTRNVLVDPGSITYDSFLDGSVPINGKSINTFYSYQFKGLDPNEGFPIFYGAEPENAVKLTEQYNNMSKEASFQTVMVESGRREPVLQGAIANSFTFKNWSLSFSVNYSVGNKIRLLKIASGDYSTFKPSSQQNLRNEFVNRWRLPGDELITNIPGIQGNNWVTINNPGKAGWWHAPATNLTYDFADNYFQMYDFSDLRVVSGDYVKLQHAYITYKLLSEQCKKLHIKGGLVTFSGTNLFVVANKKLLGQDPSQTGSSANINLSIRPNYSLTINISL